MTYTYDQVYGAARTSTNVVYISLTDGVYTVKGPYPAMVVEAPVAARLMRELGLDMVRE